MISPFSSFPITQPCRVLSDVCIASSTNRDSQRLGAKTASSKDKIKGRSAGLAGRIIIGRSGVLFFPGSLPIRLQTSYFRWQNGLRVAAVVQSLAMAASLTD